MNLPWVRQMKLARLARPLTHGKALKKLILCPVVHPAGRHLRWPRGQRLWRLVQTPVVQSDNLPRFVVWLGSSQPTDVARAGALWHLPHRWTKPAPLPARLLTMP